ncbi:hypothetical protein AVEN_219439-1 [Araneus ventricosus]|uniref:Uncharacterized protein n=1 Tax=Araneus ventricosus TaxID=182803 RepID=A0A4Y2BM35_ARAVE|nr:hypothetical protein AVEN_219439-1 [Araneus ventricosus]
MLYDSIATWNIVTSMESCFPAMLVLWMGRELCRGMYGNARRMEPSTPNLGEKLGNHFGGKFVDEMWDLISTGIFLISLLVAEIRIYPDDSI